MNKVNTDGQASVQESEIKDWINEILKRDITVEYLSGKDMDTDRSVPLEDILKNGIVLCDLVNRIIENDPLLRNTMKCPSRSTLSFFQMENIAYFIEKARALGVPDSENFQTIDLFEGKNIKQVYTCIYSLSRNLYKNGRTEIRVIGPKLVEKVSINFTKEQLDEAKRTVSLQYGFMRNK